MDIVKSLDIPPRENASDPMILKLSFHNDKRYFKEFNRIKRLDEICFKRIAGLIKIPHSRVRQPITGADAKSRAAQFNRWQNIT